MTSFRYLALNGSFAKPEAHQYIERERRRMRLKYDRSRGVFHL